MEELVKVLAVIQQKLVAPKGERNTFAKFNYRTCEGILEAVKPLLGGHTLILTDDMVEVAGKAYVKATAQISNGKETISVKGFAREAQDKKGMDAAQMTGTASSYARKYALSGLFAIDGNDDIDSMDNSKPAVIDGPDKKALTESVQTRKDFWGWPEERRNEVWDKLSAVTADQINRGV